MISLTQLLGLARRRIFRIRISDPVFGELVFHPRPMSISFWQGHSSLMEFTDEKPIKVFVAGDERGPTMGSQEFFSRLLERFSEISEQAGPVLRGLEPPIDCLVVGSWRTQTVKLLELTIPARLEEMREWSMRFRVCWGRNRFELVHVYMRGWQPTGETDRIYWPIWAQHV